MPTKVWHTTVIQGILQINFMESSVGSNLRFNTDAYPKKKDTHKVHFQIIHNLQLNCNFSANIHNFPFMFYCTWLNQHFFFLFHWIMVLYSLPHKYSLQKMVRNWTCAENCTCIHKFINCTWLSRNIMYSIFVNVGNMIYTL